ncbi:MAG: mechanosensitive ion channel family protein [Wenzhouxiangellaceae bacterium]|nr:mechanosensitive ion channel family protein [Wenzhouxiangellaceae bacterium]
MSANVVPVWLPQTLHPVWAFLADWPPVLALVIVLVGCALALAVHRVVGTACRSIAGRLPLDLGVRLLGIARYLAALLIVYLALAVALQVLGLPGRVADIAVKLLKSVLVLQLMRQGLKAGHLALEVLGHVRDRFAVIEARTLPLFDLLLTVLTIAFATYALLMVWNIDPTAWLASAGVIGIAVGFAARETLANLFGGFSIIADAPYKVGDYIVLDTGERGEVTRVGIRSTRILTRDDVEVTMPNSIMANSKIVNESGGTQERFRIRLAIGVAYGSDIEQIVELLEALASDHPTVSREPTPRVRMRGFGDSSLDFELLCWVDRPVQRGLVTHELYMKIYREFERAGIVIPFPQRDVWMRSEPASETAIQTADERG